MGSAAPGEGAAGQGAPSWNVNDAGAHIYPIPILQAAECRAHLHSLRSLWSQPGFQLWNSNVSRVARVKLSSMFTLIGTGAASSWKMEIFFKLTHFREVWFHQASAGSFLKAPCHGHPSGWSSRGQSVLLTQSASQHPLFRALGHPLLSLCFFQADYESCLKRKEMVAQGQVLAQFPLQPICQLNGSKNLFSTKWQMRP